MQLKFYTVPATGSYLIEDEINKFLRSHRILKVDRTFCPESGGYWTLCVEYMDIESLAEVPAFKKGQTDATEGLSDEERKRYDRYKEIRLVVSRENGIKAYNVFSNHELALLSKLPVIDASITEIKGVTPSRLKEFLPFFYTDNVSNAQESQTSEGESAPF